MAKKVVKTAKVTQPKPKSTVKFDTKTKYAGATYVPNVPTSSTKVTKGKSK